MTTLPTFSDDPEGVAVRIAGAVLFVSGVGWLPWPASAEHARRLIQNSIVIRHSAVVLLVDRSPSWKGPKALPLPGRPARAPPPTIPRPDEPPAQQDDPSVYLESRAQESTPVTVRPPRSNPTERPPLTSVPLQSELPRPPEVRRSNDISGFDHYAQSSDRTADERHVLDLLEGWKIAMALLPASSGSKRKPLVTAPFDATAAKQYVSATAFKTGQAPLAQSDLVALSEALSAMSVWRRAKQAVPGETYAPAIAFSAPPNLAGLHPSSQPDQEESFEDFCASFPPWPEVAPPVASRPILTLSELLASPTLHDAISKRHVGELCAGVGTMSRSHRDLGAVPKVLIELDASDRAFLDSVFPSVDVSYGDFFAYDWMTSTTASLLSVYGGISCVFCSDAGRALGARDERSSISTFALPFMANHFRAPFADFENVVGIARADNGSVLHALDAHFASFNYIRTPRVPGQRRRPRNRPPQPRRFAGYWRPRRRPLRA